MRIILSTKRSYIFPLDDRKREKNLNFQQASDGNVAHLLIQDKYRVYSGIGRSDRITVTKEDSLTQERFRQILNEVYNIKYVDETNLDLDRYRMSQRRCQ